VYTSSERGVQINTLIVSKEDYYKTYVPVLTIDTILDYIMQYVMYFAPQ